MFVPSVSTTAPIRRWPRDDSPWAAAPGVIRPVASAPGTRIRCTSCPRSPPTTAARRCGRGGGNFPQGGRPRFLRLQRPAGPAGLRGSAVPASGTQGKACEAARANGMSVGRLASAGDLTSRAQLLGVLEVRVRRSNVAFRVISKISSRHRCCRIETAARSAPSIVGMRLPVERRAPSCTLSEHCATARTRGRISHRVPRARTVRAPHRPSAPSPSYSFARSRIFTRQSRPLRRARRAHLLVVVLERDRVWVGFHHDQVCPAYAASMRLFVISRIAFILALISCCPRAPLTPASLLWLSSQALGVLVALHGTRPGEHRYRDQQRITPPDLDSHRAGSPPARHRQQPMYRLCAPEIHSLRWCRARARAGSFTPRSLSFRTMLQRR